MKSTSMTLRGLLVLTLLPAWSISVQAQGTPLPGIHEPSNTSEAGAPVQPAKAPAPDFAALKKQADGGDGPAQVQVAAAILSGAIKGATPAEAAAYLEKAADSAFAPGCFAFARLLATGAPGVPADQERAQFLIQQAAEAGHPPAQAAWGYHLERQVDPKARDVNYDEVLSWYRKAAAKNDPEGICRLGMLTAAGSGMKADPAAGWALIHKAAQTGLPLALNEAGVMLSNGSGIPADPVAAIGYFQVAGDLGDITALLNLARLYELGEAVPQNFERAGAAYARAARAGNPLAQFFLAHMFEEGLGTPKDDGSAWVNYSRAARGGLEQASAARDRVAARLSPEKTKALVKQFPEIDQKPKSAD